MESGISTPGLEASERSALLASDRAERGQYGFTADPTAKVKAPKGVLDILECKDLTTTTSLDALDPIAKTSKWSKAKYYLPILSWLPNYAPSLWDFILVLLKQSPNAVWWQISWWFSSRSDSRLHLGSAVGQLCVFVGQNEPHIRTGQPFNSS